MTTPFEYALENQDTFLRELTEFLRIPSISAQPQHKADVRKAAEWAAAHCLSLGMSRAEIMDTEGHPVVYAEWLGAGSKAPTVIFYGHYDVQPAELKDGWHTEPFQPVIMDDKIFGRGTADDKGQVFIHLKAFESFMKTTGTFPVNLKILLEGEEEVGSIHLRPFIKSHAELLKADVGLVSDSGMIAPGMPTIVYGLRGLVELEIYVTGPDHDLHSGAYGGTVDNPNHAISRIVASLHDAQGRIAIPGFSDDVRVLTPDERETISHVPFTEAMWKAETNAPAIWGDPDFTLKERTGARPTIEVNGLFGGYTGEGSKTIIPSKATAKITCRLVPNQNPQKVFEAIQRHVAAHTPPSVRSEVSFKRGEPGIVVDPHDPAMQVAVEAYQHSFGKEAIFSLEGGSIPAVMMLRESLGIPVILMGFGLPDDRLHSPNEKFSLEQFRLGIQTAIEFYRLLPEHKN